MADRLRARAAIAGVGESDLGVVGAGRVPLDLIAQASVRALDDAGLAKDDVDAVFSASAYHNLVALDVAEHLGLAPRYMDSTNIGGSSFVAHLLHAAAAIDTGLCSVALIAYGSTQRSDSGRLVSRTEQPWHEAAVGLRFPVSMYALAAARHMHEFGTTRGQLAEVAVAARKWAQLTPGAFMREPLSIDDVISSPMVSSPLRVRDCCLVTDGGGAVLLVGGERARALRQPPIYLLGGGEATSHRHISGMADLVRTAAADAARRAYAMAGVHPREISLVELYDAFTINTILLLEDLGFCAKGEGGAYVADGRIAPGGALPVNTNGGGLSYCHPGMYGIFLIIEAARQLRGQAATRQVPGAELAVAHGNGGVLSSQVTAVLGTPATV